MFARGLVYAAVGSVCPCRAFRGKKKNLHTDVSTHVKDARTDRTEALKTSSIAFVDLASMETVLHGFPSQNVLARTLTSFVRTPLRLADGILVSPVSDLGEMDVY